MIVWVIYGNEIGNNGNGAAYFATKAAANAARREYMSDQGNGCGNMIDPPEKLLVRNRKDLAKRLNDATGWGAS